jgi:predicted oxidoreductase
MTEFDASASEHGFGVELGRIAYGCWRFAGATLDAAVDLIETAVSCGMTLIDTADVYGWGSDAGFGGAEDLLGQVFDEVPGLRERVILATKGGIVPPLPYDSSADALRQAIDASLYRLRTDAIDLYQIHRPDFLAHPGEVAEALSEAREAGKIREVGVSNYTTAQFETLQSYLEFPIVAMQPEFSLAHLDPLTDGTLDLAMELGLTPLAWSPLGGGVLVEDKPSDPRHLAVAEVCDRLAADAGVDRSAILLAWLMHHPANIVPIVGTQQPSRIRAAAEAVEIGLSRQGWYEILVAARGEAMP